MSARIDEKTHLSPVSETLVVSTARVLAVVLLASSLITLDVLGAAPTGRLGAGLVAMLIVLRVYGLVAVLALARSKVEARVEGDVEGTPLRVAYRICNESLLPIALLEFSLRYPDYLKLVRGAPGGLALIPPRGCFEYTVEFTARVGSHTIGPIVAVYRDVFGFFRGVETNLGAPLRVVVHPRVDERVSRVALAVSRSVGLTRAGRSGEGVEFHSVREYAPGDELRRVFWRALAKGRLAVKEFERESTLYTLFILVADEGMAMGPYLNTPLEHSLRVITAITRYLARRNDYVALAVVTPGGVSVSKFERGRRGLIALKRVLPSISFEYLRPREGRARAETTTVLAQLKREVLKILPRDRVNIIVVSTSRTAMMAADALKDLLGIRGVTLYFFLLLPHLYGLEKLSEFERAVYRIRTYQLTLDAQQVARELRRRGFHAVIVTPWDMAMKILTRIERLR